MTANIWHSCGRYRLADHFKGKPQTVRETFDRLVEVARSYGPTTMHAQKTRIVLQGRVRFAGVVVKKNWLDAGVWLKKEVSHPRLVRTESYGKLGYGHHFLLFTPADIDDALVKLIGQAYVIGQQESTNDDHSNWWSKKAVKKRT